MELKARTEQLLHNLVQLKEWHETHTAPENKKDQAYFKFVKKETDPIFDQLDTWESEALELVKKRIIDVHPHQVASTKENMELLLLHSYYKDARRKRYMELYKSVRYIFDQIISELS